MKVKEITTNRGDIIMTINRLSDNDANYYLQHEFKIIKEHDSSFHKKLCATTRSFLPKLYILLTFASGECNNMKMPGSRASFNFFFEIEFHNDTQIRKYYLDLYSINNILQYGYCMRAEDYAATNLLLVNNFKRELQEMEDHMLHVATRTATNFQ